MFTFGAPSVWKGCQAATRKKQAQRRAARPPHVARDQRRPGSENRPGGLGRREQVGGQRTSRLLDTPLGLPTAAPATRHGRADYHWRSKAGYLPALLTGTTGASTQRGNMVPPPSASAEASGINAKATPRIQATTTVRMLKRRADIGRLLSELARPGPRPARLVGTEIVWPTVQWVKYL